MQPQTAIVEQAHYLVEQLTPLVAATLRVVAERLLLFARSPLWQSAPYRAAAHGEELLYELAVTVGNRPSLYLVSDGIGVTSPPHCHGTWAVVAGIRGMTFLPLLLMPGTTKRLTRSAS